MSIAYPMNWIVTFIVLGIFAKGMRGNAQVNVQDVDNAEQFALLCRIYNVAKNPPIHHFDLQDPLKIVNEIDALNDSFTEEHQLNKTEHVGNSSDTKVKTTITREEAVAQAIIRRIKQTAHTILDDITNLNATRNIEKIKSDFAQVIFGEKGNEDNLCQATVNGMDNRSKACGPPGLKTKGESAGKNLVVDFFCLCARRTDTDGVDQACSIYVGGKGGHHGWGDVGPWGSSSMWATIKKGCGRLMHQHPKSTKEGHEVINDFLNHLKLGGLYRLSEIRGNPVKQKGRKQAMLGTASGTEDGVAADILCDGKKGNGRNQPPGGVCVYYGPESEWDNIDWLKKLRTALNEVDTLNNKTAIMQRDIQKLQMLLHRAEQIYETTKVISEVQNPVLPTNLQTAAKRLTAYNAAWSHHPHTHFILLFVLF